uniref:sugar 3,4-ketoisomerase n=1 Tax=Algoriphagus sp. TaxID=1872435 RepID=UPI0040475578
MSIYQSKNFQIINLPKIHDIRGNLSFFESNNHIPFVIKRAYWIYDVPGGESRGGHAFKNQQQFILSLSGSFDVNLYDGNADYKITLNRSYLGVLIKSLTWLQLDNFSTNSLALIVNSQYYNELDYVRSKEEFNKIISK